MRLFFWSCVYPELLYHQPPRLVGVRALAVSQPAGPASRATALFGLFAKKLLCKMVNCAVFVVTQPLVLQRGGHFKTDLFFFQTFFKMSILRKLINKTEQKRCQNVAGSLVVDSIDQILEKLPMELRFERGKSWSSAVSSNLSQFHLKKHLLKCWFSEN